MAGCDEGVWSQLRVFFFWFFFIFRDGGWKWDMM